MCCLVAIAGFIGPRVALAIVWIFGSRVDLAFGSWVWPLLGLVFLPWTTLAYVLAWQPGGLHGGWDYLLLAIGVALDVGTYSARSARKRAAAW